MYIFSRLSRKTGATAGVQGITLQKRPLGGQPKTLPRHCIEKKGLEWLVTLFCRIRSLLTCLVPFYSERGKMSSVHHLYPKAAASTLEAAKNWNVNDRGPDWELTVGLCLEIQRGIEPWWGLGGWIGRVSQAGAPGPRGWTGKGSLSETNASTDKLARLGDRTPEACCTEGGHSMWRKACVGMGL